MPLLRRTISRIVLSAGAATLVGIAAFPSAASATVTISHCDYEDFYKQVGCLAGEAAACKAQDITNEVTIMAGDVYCRPA